MLDPTERARRVKLVIFDVDGVLTDGGLYVSDAGTEYKAFNSRDGHGMVMLRDSGVTLAVITGRQSEVVRIRMQSLGVKYIFQGQRDKLPAYEALRDKLALADEEIAYVGDDVVDLPVLCRVGLAIAVANAHPLVLTHAHWTTRADGGRGAAREVCEFVLAAQGKLDELFAGYLCA